MRFLRTSRNEWVMRNVLRMRGCVRLELELGGVQSVVGGATVAIPHQPLQQPLATMRVAELWANHVNDVKTGQSVLRECISFDNFEKASLLDMFVKYNVDGHLKIKKLQTTALHVACTAPSGAPWVKMLCVSGSQVNEKNEERQTPLHLVLLGDLREDSSGNAEECVRLLLQFGADPNADDCEGDTPLLYVRTLLQEGLHKEAASMARLLLEGGADPNRVNKQGRSLLTYSVCHLDDALALTRLLLNSGASVWGPGPEHPDQSCFSWFLKAIIQRRLLENCSQTMGLLSQVMGEAPQRMHSHVLRTMFRHVRCYQVLGPVFLQIKLSMMRYWSAPQDLKYLCWKALRKNMAPRKVVGSAARLGLPGPLQRYVLME